MQGLSSISSCRHCRFYQLEGRRGGTCQQLGVPVQGDWKACQLAVPPFVHCKQQDNAWKLEAIELAESCFAVNQSTVNTALTPNHPIKNLSQATELRSLVSVSAIGRSGQVPFAPIA